MGKVKIGKSQLKNEYTGSPVESAFSKEEMLAIAKNTMQRHIDTFRKLAEQESKETILIETKIVEVPGSTKDKRARQYTKAVKNLLIEDNEFLLEQILECKESINKLEANQKSNILKLEKENSKLCHQLELIEQELKVKPVHIKETKVVERFDHRLLIINLVLIFLNIILLCK